MSNFKLVHNVKKLGTITDHALTAVETTVTKGTVALDIIASEGVHTLEEWQKDQQAARTVAAKVRPQIAKLRAIKELQEEIGEEFSTDDAKSLLALLNK